jgi:undecaprenyl pyrophosphate phosphatase UppP
MIVLGTIPVGVVGVIAQKAVTGIFAKPMLTAVFLAINGGVLLFSERQRQRQARAVVAGPGGDWDADGGNWGGEGDDGRDGRDRRAFGPHGTVPRHGAPRGGDPRGGGPRFDPDAQRGGDPRRGGPRHGGNPRERGDNDRYADEEPTRAWNQQPGQQQWQGPSEPRFEPDPRYNDPRHGTGPRHGQDPRGPQDPGAGPGPSFTPAGADPRPAGQVPPYVPDAAPADAPQQDPRYAQEPRFSPAGAPSFTPAGQAPAAPQAPDPRLDPRGGQDGPPWEEHGPGPQGAPNAWAERDPRDGEARDGDPRDGGQRRDPRGPRPPARDLDPRERDFDSRGAERDPAVAADRRLATMTYKMAIFIGAYQILALLPGISRDGIVTVGGMRKRLRRDDAVRYSFLLSAPAILAAGLLKLPDLAGPQGHGILGPVIVGSILAGIGAYFSLKFLMKYFSEDKSLKPFGYYCLIAGIGSFVLLLLHV